MARRYVSNKNESVRMFKSNFLEFCSHVHPITPLVIYLPLIGYMLYLCVERETSFGAIISFFLLGFLIWTLLEYTLHRFVFHYQPRTDWGKQLHFMMHGVHHDYPRDATRLVMPPSFSLPLAVIFYLLFNAIFEIYAPAAYAGIVFGYLCYDMIHYATHHFQMNSGIALWLKQNHMRHHYHDDDSGYGVSSPLWDLIFRTYRPSPSSASETSGAVEQH